MRSSSSTGSYQRRGMEVLMENTAAKKKSSLRHRFTQMLLGSSCTSTTTYSAIKLVNFSSPAPQPQQPPEAQSDCGTEEQQQKQCRRRRKVDGSADCFAPRVPVVQVSIDCGARHSIHSYEPFLPSTPKVEKSDKLKEKRPTALYEALKKEQKRLPPALLSTCSRNISSSHSYRGETAKNRKKISNQKKDKGKKKETMRLLSNSYGFSSSSFYDSGTEHGPYSSGEDDDEEESAGTLFSSRSFSSDSSEFYRSKRKNSTGSNNKKKSSSASMKCTQRPAWPVNSGRAPRPHKDGLDARDNFRPLVSYSSSSSQKAATKTEPVAGDADAEEEKAKAAEGFAVVKSSSDPYTDFRSSMVEMIVERRIRSAKDLEGLLRSYLCLNSAQHHPAILEAFKDIWDAIFCCLD